MREKREMIRKRGKGAVAAAIICTWLLGGCGNVADVEDMFVQTVAQQEQTSEEDRASEDTQKSEENAATESSRISEDVETLDRNQIKEEEGAQIVTWNAMIEGVGVDSFTVSEIFTEDMGDGLVAVYSAEEEDKVLNKVTYTNQTVFTVRTTYNGGMSHSDSQGSAADLKADMSVVLTGSWDGDEFRALEVLIYNHQ